MDPNVGAGVLDGPHRMHELIRRNLMWKREVVPPEGPSLSPMNAENSRLQGDTGQVVDDRLHGAGDPLVPVVEQLYP